ncbi:hypothetical protein LUZ60_006977 [Juncus effusus]|nr:hypothetical protein LUZ60_006977 [Juncus effusus]
MFFSFFLGLLLGFACVLGLEALVFVYVLEWIERKNQAALDLVENTESCGLHGESAINLSSNKQGYVWILEPEKIPKTNSDDSKDKKEKINYVEVLPVKKHAKIEDHLLILSGHDSSRTEIDLSNCIVLAVSSSNQPSRKWAKRYPIKIESKEPSLNIYNNTPTIFLYCETSWEKESWCKSLRIASTTDDKKLQSRRKLIQNYENYLAALNAKYPSFTKPYFALNAELADRIGRTESGKVKTFLKKIVRKASNKPAILESRSSGFSQHEKRVLENAEISRGSLQDLQLETLDERVDEGVMCLNLFFSRLFFDVKMSDKINTAMHARIQRALSSMRTPSYISQITLTNFTLGSLPPHIHRLKPVQSNLSDLTTAFEADLELSGGLLVNMETRLDVGAKELQKEFEQETQESSGLLEGLEDFRRQFSAPELEIKDETGLFNGLLKHSKSASWATTYTSRWKHILNSIATKVNQVPLSLTIRANSIKGTVRFHIKSPPSDEIWYGFVTMPEIDWCIESSIGERKISSNRIASLLANRFKASICSTMVLPNCECISIPWMMSETDDWAPLKSAPFIWINNENAPNLSTIYENTPNNTKNYENAPKSELFTSTISIVRAESAPVKEEIVKSMVLVKEDSIELEPSSSNLITGDVQLVNLEKQESRDISPVGNEVICRDISPVVLPNGEDLKLNWRGEREDLRMNWRGDSSALNREDSSSQSAKLGRRVRMMDFKRKMEDKLGENRRKIEEKGRSFVEKIKENRNMTQ